MTVVAGQRPYLVLGARAFSGVPVGGCGGGHRDRAGDC